MTKETFKDRLLAKYRISILNENTLNESGHIHLSRAGMILTVFVLFVLSFVLFASIIWFTPLKNYLPGYNQNVRQELISATERVDSLAYQLQLQAQYMDVIRGVISGEVKSDTVHTLDSMAIIQREKLLEEKSAITEEFIVEYEAKGKDYLSLFDAASTVPIFTFCAPAKGILKEPFTNNHTGISLLTAENLPILATLDGTVVFAQLTLDNQWVVIVQHKDTYLSIYKNLKKIICKVGGEVRAAETLGLANGGQPFYFELWHHNQPINPQEVIPHL